jgi:hypothetical protein
VQPEATPAPAPKMAVDEVLINGRRFRVPERVIKMDFWSKTGKGSLHREEYVSTSEIFSMTKLLVSDRDRLLSSVASSPLTSLSSVDPMDEDDIEDIAATVPARDTSLRFDLRQLRAAMVGPLSYACEAQSYVPRRPFVVCRGVLRQSRYPMASQPRRQQKLLSLFPSYL